MQPSGDVRRLIEIMAALRAPDTGCPWDLEQTHETLAPYALEEAYEVVDAIERKNSEDLKDELGDLLLQVVFHSRLAEEAGRFRFGDVVEGVTSKMIRRHPHVFDGKPTAAPKTGLSGVDIVWEAMKAKREGAGPSDHGLIGAMPSDRSTATANATWEAIKADERRERGQETKAGLLAEVPNALPGLTRAIKLQAKASTVGFDWGDAKLVLAKIREEIEEVEQTFDAKAPNQDEVADEIGDLLFAVANLARHANIDPDSAVRRANGKFERRFAFIEQALSARGSSPAQSNLSEMDQLWDQAKAEGL